MVGIQRKLPLWCNWVYFCKQTIKTDHYLSFFLDIPTLDHFYNGGMFLLLLFLFVWVDPFWWSHTQTSKFIRSIDRSHDRWSVDVVGNSSHQTILFTGGSNGECDTLGIRYERFHSPNVLHFFSIRRMIVTRFFSLYGRMVYPREGKDRVIIIIIIDCIVMLFHL